MEAAKRRCKNNTRPVVLGSLDNHAPPYMHGGILHAPPPPSLYYSCPPFPLLNPLPPRQPPLLPLPIQKPDPNPAYRTWSCPPVTRKTNNRTKEQPQTTKKAKPQKQVDDPMRELRSADTGRANPEGPYPKKDLPVDVFTISPPPPSSLPLPTFFLRPKLSCNAEAAGVDDGATDNLRRILRLR